MSSEEERELDIMERLRGRVVYKVDGGKTIADPICVEAADEIESLRQACRAMARDLVRAKGEIERLKGSDVLCAD